LQNLATPLNAIAVYIRPQIQFHYAKRAVN